MKTRHPTVGLQGTRLEYLHLNYGLTWQRIANLLGVSVKMVHKVRCGERQFSDKMLVKLRRVEVDYAGGEDPVDPNEVIELKKEVALLREFNTRLMDQAADARARSMQAQSHADYLVRKLGRI